MCIFKTVVRLGVIGGNESCEELVQPRCVWRHVSLQRGSTVMTTDFAASGKFWGVYLLFYGLGLKGQITRDWWGGRLRQYSCGLAIEVFDCVCFVNKADKDGPRSQLLSPRCQNDMLPRCCAVNPIKLKFKCAPCNIFSWSETVIYCLMASC